MERTPCQYNTLARLYNYATIKESICPRHKIVSKYAADNCAYSNINILCTYVSAKLDAYDKFSQINMLACIDWLRFSGGQAKNLVQIFAPVIFL